MNRRDFLRTTAVTGATLALGRTLAFAVDPTTSPAGRPLRVGLISDLHHALFGRDQLSRLRAFVDRANATGADFILQNGDFCYPAGLPAVLAEWNRFPGDKFHVLGNHDMDKCDKATTVRLWGMAAPYYSFDRGGFHFVVLDRNNFRDKATKAIVSYDRGNWGHAASADLNCCDEPQLAWLADDLAKTGKPTVLFMHQPLIATNFPQDAGNGRDLLKLIDTANYAALKATGRQRVVAAFLGHDHDDLYAERNGVHWVLLNSASYAYNASGASFYRDPLFAFVTFDAAAGRIAIEGTTTEYASAKVPDSVRMQFAPRISSRSLANS